MCRNMTASWVRAKAGKGKGAKQEETPDKQIELCDFYEVWLALDDSGWTIKQETTSNWKQPILPIQFPMVYIP